jgi:tRNA (guanine10-N2)-dimethyltransferase
MIVCLLGRQPELSLAELECQFGAAAVRPVSDLAALVSTEAFDIQKVGGVIKAGLVDAELPSRPWPKLQREIVAFYEKQLSETSGKLTIGISVYGASVPGRDVGKTGLMLKQSLKHRGVSVRLVPNEDAALSSASSHHNKLGLSPKKVEILIICGKNSVILARSTGSQNISRLAARDQARPKRDAFVGMLPPKLALMMVNLTGITGPSRSVILDPFCGTGVVLQEAALLGFDVYGSDLSDKMIDYTRQNLEWLTTKYRLATNVVIENGDAQDHVWQAPFDAVVAETYLGQPFSAPPAPDKLEKVVGITNTITTKFLKNIASQLKAGTPLVLAVPAWRDSQGNPTYLPCLFDIEKLGYQWQPLKHADAKHLLYYREDQVVARQLLLLSKR